MTDIKKIYGDYYSDASNGEVPGVTIVHKFGRFTNLGTSEEDIRAEGGTFSWPTSGYPIEAISGSAADAAAGTGARVITIEGLLAGTWENASADITMNGTSATTATDSSWIRINRAYVKESGTYSNTTSGGNAGLITIRFESAGQTMTIISSGNPSPAQTQQTHYTVPASNTAMIKAITANVDSSKVATIRGWKRRDADTIAAPFTARRSFIALDGTVGVNPVPLAFPIDDFPAKTDIWFSGVATASGAAVEVDYIIELRDM